MSLKTFPVLKPHNFNLPTFHTSIEVRRFDRYKDRRLYDVCSRVKILRGRYFKFYHFCRITFRQSMIFLLNKSHFIEVQFIEARNYFAVPDIIFFQLCCDSDVVHPVLCIRPKLFTLLCSGFVAHHDETRRPRFTRRLRRCLCPVFKRQVAAIYRTL